jgi:hypothetical protein
MLKNKNGFKKFFVVSDSVTRLLSLIQQFSGEDAYKSYFILIDEVEQNQTEANYRTNMSLAFDHYKLFPKDMRAMVSAFVYQFSDPVLAAEPTTTLVYAIPTRRSIDLCITNNPILETVMSLKEVDGKALIFMNSLKGIRQIISLLGLTIEDCGIYCGEGSIENAGDYYKKFESSPPYKYNFLTSSFYSGVDVFGKYDIFTVIDTRIRHSVLSPSKLKQIHGRTRNGCLKDIIISNYSLRLKNNWRGFDKVAVEKAKKCVALAQLNQGLADDKLFENIKRLIVKQEMDGMLLTRVDIQGNVVPHYEEIDNKHIKLKAGDLHYSSPTGLKELLTETMKSTVRQNFRDHGFTEEQRKQLKEMRAVSKSERILASKEIYQLIEDYKIKIENDIVEKIQLNGIRLEMYNLTGIKKEMLKLYLDYRNADLILESKGRIGFINRYRVSSDFCSR